MRRTRNSILPCNGSRPWSPIAPATWHKAKALLAYQTPASVPGSGKQRPRGILYGRRFATLPRPNACLRWPSFRSISVCGAAVMHRSAYSYGLWLSAPGSCGPGVVLGAAKPTEPWGKTHAAVLALSVEFWNDTGWSSRAASPRHLQPATRAESPGRHSAAIAGSDWAAGS